MPLSFGGDFPASYFNVAPEEREQRIELAESLCVIDKALFFHRGRITIPIVDHNEDLVFDVWTSISEANFIKRNDLWSDPNRIKQDPYFGWLQSTIPTYDGTLNIKTLAYEQEVGFIPSIKVIEENHPLKIDQENGITLKIATEKVESILRDFHRDEAFRN